MLLGPGNPCSTLLEIVSGVSEMHRVLHPVGFAYLADGILHPSVCFATQILGFTVLVSKGTENGMSVGTILAKGPASEESWQCFLPEQRFPRLTFHPIATR